MEIGAAAAGVSAGVHALWGYNRKNFLFDREMRQKNEFQVLDWRCKQAELWREDVRDIIGLTEKKMDTYTIVSALQLGMCVGLFTEGRLEPGTPPWLLHFYMLTLAAGFMYLLMSVWLAMHASIVAQCSSVRLLTQFVRLPVPTWEELEGMRTYAEAYEGVGGRQMLRVPFFGQGAKTVDAPADAAAAKAEFASGSGAEQEDDAREAGGASSSGAAACSSSPAPVAAADPWGLEAHGDHRGLEELRAMPVALRRHVALARRAAEQYKCFDAFARVAMTFGTNQMLQAITYYCLGYVSIQDGAPWAAWCVGAIMVTIAVAMVHLDISLTRREQGTAQCLLLTGPACTSCATWLWARNGKEATASVLMLLPVACASHGLWLLWSLRACGVERRPGGAVLPTRFRAVLYLDVFGWLSSDDQGLQPAPEEQDACRPAPRRLTFEDEATEAPDSARSPERLSQLQEDLRENIALWQSERVQRAMDEQEKARVDQLARRFNEAIGADPDEPLVGEPVPQAAEAAGAPGASSAESAPIGSSPEANRSPWVKLHGYSDFGTEAPYLYDPDSGEVMHMANDNGAASSQEVRTITFAEEEVERYCTHSAKLRSEDSAQPRRASASEPAVTTSPFSKGIGASPGATQQGPKRAKSVPGQAAAGAEAGPFACCTPGGLESHELELQPGFGPPAGPGLQRRRGSGPEHRPIGPSGAFHVAPDHAFQPQSFLPDGQAVPSDAEEEEIVTGHDRVRPGELPWRIFRSATLLLAVLWFLGLALPFGVFREIMTKPQIAEIHVEGEGKGDGVEHFAVGTDPSGLPEYIPEVFDRSLPELPEGELIRATWPSHSGFTPRALGSAPVGDQLVVADDFGVYSGRLGMGFEYADEAPDEVEASVDARRLRGRQLPAPVPMVHFRHAPPCTALEGQALKDISVVCSEGASSTCRVIVLHAHGRRLVECPLRNPEGDEDLDAEAEEVAEAVNPEAEEDIIGPLQKHNLTWVISSDWLHGHSRSKEYVASVAVNNECLGGAFHPDKVGCVVVGTTSGRIVQLRGHLTNETRLVPERAVQQWSQAVEHGSLHVFPSGFVVALHKRSGSIQAFDARAGKAVGEWRLPRHIKWLMLSGAGDYLFALGQENRTELQLYRFPVPQELWAARGRAALHFGGRGF